METEQQPQWQNTIDSHQRLKQLAEAIEPYTSAISNVLMANMDAIALQTPKEPETNDMHSSSNSLLIRGITVRVATHRVDDS